MRKAILILLILYVSVFLTKIDAYDKPGEKDQYVECVYSFSGYDYLFYYNRTQNIFELVPPTGGAYFTPIYNGTLSEYYFFNSADNKVYCPSNVKYYSYLANSPGGQDYNTVQYFVQAEGKILDNGGMMTSLEKYYTIGLNESLSVIKNPNNAPPPKVEKVECEFNSIGLLDSYRGVGSNYWQPEPGGNLIIEIDLKNKTMQAPRLSGKNGYTVTADGNTAKRMLENVDNFLENGKCKNPNAIPVWTSCISNYDGYGNPKSGGSCSFSFDAPDTDEGRNEFIFHEIADFKVCEPDSRECCENLNENIQRIKRGCLLIIDGKNEEQKKKCYDFFTGGAGTKSLEACKLGMTEAAGCGILGKNTITFLSNILTWIQYGGVILVIVLGTLDFIKAIAADDQDAIKKSSSKFIKRLVALALLFLLPALIKTILGMPPVSNEIPDDPLCDIITKK